MVLASAVVFRRTCEVIVKDWTDDMMFGWFAEEKLREKLALIRGKTRLMREWCA